MEPYVKPFILCPTCNSGNLVLAGQNYVCKDCGGKHDQMITLDQLKKRFEQNSN